LLALVGAGVCFGIGFGMADANNMPILCQFIGGRQRATAYGLMNFFGVLSGALVTQWLGKATDAGHLGRDFSLLTVIVLVAVVMLLVFLRPKTQEFQDQ
jgi:sugar phosphate permease